MIRRVLFLSNVPWDFVWQRHQTLAALWAGRARVDYVEIPGVRRPTWRDGGRVLGRIRRQLGLASKSPTSASPPPPGVTVHRPWVLPAVTPALCRLNRSLLARALARTTALRGPYDLAVVYSPARTTLQWLDQVSCRLIVYDCTDDLPAVRGVPDFFAADEEILLARADLTLVPGRVLLERKRARARQIRRLPHGALVERFLPSSEEKSPSDGTALTVLYYGHLHRQHLDFDALDRLARSRPDWRIVLVGPERSKHAWPANVERPGQVAHERLREHIVRAHALLLPYVLNRYTEAVLPAKTFECLATGLPVLATPLPELTAEFMHEMAFVAPGDDWAGRVEEVVRSDTEVARSRRIEIARKNTWRARFEQMAAWVDELEVRT